MPEAEEKHELKIVSLRDISAFCTCGLWAMLCPASDDESDDYLRGKVRFAHNLHAMRFSTTTETRDAR